MARYYTVIQNFHNNRELLTETKEIIDQSNTICYQALSNDLMQNLITAIKNLKIFIAWCQED